MSEMLKSALTFGPTPQKKVSKKSAHKCLYINLLAAYLTKLTFLTMFQVVIFLGGEKKDHNDYFAP